jgi:uncharacterized iron-regulated membrane protein
MLKLLRKSLILTHRYLGIALSLLVVMWFASGIVMIYTGGMPRLTPQLRLERMPALNLASIGLSPAEAAQRAGLRNTPARTLLLSVMNRPAYRFGRQTVFADTGEILKPATLDQSADIAARFVGLPLNQVHYVRTLDEDVDQWTIGQGRQLPLHKFRVDDADGTELYVQPATGEVSLLTTSRGRALAWMGTIPHWLYFTAIRVNQPLWYRVVVWTSTVACVLAVLGLALSVTQFRRTKPLRVSASIPYAGWMRWHYITGTIFGLFTLTWAFSGLLSMEPYAWTNATGLEIDPDVFTGGSVDLSRFGRMDPVAWNRLLDGRALKEVEFTRIQDEHYYVVRYTQNENLSDVRRERLHQPYNVTGSVEPNRFLVNAQTLEPRMEPFSVDSLMTRLRANVPDAPVVESQLLTDYDWYYYSQGRQSPLPVLRVKFGDPAQTWVYIDPAMSQVLAEIHKLNRVERWLYSGLHNLDFPFLYNRRPLWDIVMIALSLGGLSLSAIGLLLGIRRVRRGTKRLVSAATLPDRGDTPYRAPATRGEAT